MGISGLLPLLKSIHKNTTLKKFAGQTIGIDGYGWLHRGAIACAVELALDKPTTKYVDFAMSRVRMLLDFGIIPYVVFDGDGLPSKAGTNEERRKRRHEAKALGLSLYKAGKTSQAYQELQKATSITPYMARLLIEELKKLDVQYVVAPYEADAQLAYLERKGIINGILSEDSDLLVFGAKRLITKLNQYGECVEIERADFPLCKEISLTGWTDAMFRRMAILSGCDYLPNIDKMGLKTAYRFVRKYKDAEKTIRMIAFEGKFCVPADYLEKFKQAELSFIHHRVFCPLEQKMVYLNDLERGMSEEEMPYLGVYVDQEQAIGVACGDLNPKTKEQIKLISDPMRPPLRDNRRQSLGTPSDLKKKSSIDNFFKPSRTPLQELDPNSLTPSPSQQRLLDRHRNASWDARPINSAPQLRRTMTETTLTGDSADRRAFLARASTMSNYQPPKRQRLCSENDDVSSSNEVEQSPFFNSNTAYLSPLAQKKSRARKSKREFDVWSDDSVDGILLGLIDSQEATSSTQQLSQQQTQDSVRKSFSSTTELDTVPQSSPIQSFEESQGPQFSNEGSQTRLLKSESSSVLQNTVIGTVSTGNDSEEFEDLLDFHVRKQHEKLAKTFVGQSSERQLSALQALPPSKKRGPSSPTTEPSDPLIRESPGKDPAKPASTLSPEDTQVPVARETSSLLRTFMYQSDDAQISALQSLSKPQSNIEKIEIARTALARERRSKVTEAGRMNRKLAGSLRNTLSVKVSSESLRGSEDELVPNSEDEASETEIDGVKPTISLKGFIFAG